LLTPERTPSLCSFLLKQTATKLINVTPITRPSLLLRVRDAADAAAWEQFVEIYTPLIFGFCRSRGLQEADAADVAQEVMRAVSRSIGRFDYNPEQGTFRSWLFTVTRNKFNNFIERRRNHPPAAGGTAVQELLEAQPCPEHDDNWDHEYHQRLFDWACDRIRPEFQENTWQAFWRTAVGEESGEEVAKALGLSVGAVYIAKSRVRMRLRECLTMVTGSHAGKMADQA
jgi:RNA polymerase sigma factor (sigma-70 family)